LGLGLQFLFTGSVSAAEDELAALLPETAAGMVRLDLSSQNTGTRWATGRYDANGDGEADLKLILRDLGDHADALRLYHEINVAEGRLMGVDIAGLAGAGAEHGNERTRTPYVAVIVGRIWAEARLGQYADEDNSAMLRQALSGLDFPALEAFVAPELTMGGRPDLPHILGPLTPGFLLPRSLAGLGQNTESAYMGQVEFTGRFFAFGGPRMAGYRYDGNVEGGPAVFASLWDFGSYSEEAERLIAARAMTENWEPITHRGYPGYVVDGAEPRLYLSVGRLRLRLDSENGGPDSAGLRMALDGIDLDRLIRFGTLIPVFSVHHDPETEEAVPANPDALANALPKSGGGFTRVDQFGYNERLEFRDVTQNLTIVKAIYEGADGSEMKVRVLDPGFEWLEGMKNMGLTEIRRGDQTILVHHVDGKTYANLVVDSRIGLVLRLRGDVTDDMLFDIVGDFNLDRISALIAGEATESDAVATSCSDQECFEAAFAACTPASFRTPKMLGARARYEVIGPVEGGCRVSLLFESNPNPQWVGKALQMTVAPEAPFIESFQNGMNACMMHKPEAACEGTLMNLLDGG